MSALRKPGNIAAMGPVSSSVPVSADFQTIQRMKADPADPTAPQARESKHPRKRADKVLSSKRDFILDYDLVQRFKRCRKSLFSVSKQL